MSSQWRAVEPLAGPPDAVVRVPGSKSITNRVVLLAALADGSTVVEGALQADDTAAMVDAALALGATVDQGDDGTTLRITGTAGLLPERASIFAKISGTTARFVAPVLATGRGTYGLDGGSALRARPLGPLVDALRQLGATVIEQGEPGHLPVVVSGPARGGRVELPGHVSSQFLSGLLLAGPLFSAGIDVELTTPLVSVPYVRMTLAVMRDFGVDVGADGPLAVGPAAYRAVANYTVEPDASAASYFFAAAAMTGGRVVVSGLRADALQGDVAFVDLLERMGADVRRRDEGIEVRGTGRLHGIDADLSDLSDTAQTLAALAVFADSPTTLRGIGFIRGKETDRIADTVRELQRCGIDAREDADGLTIVPGRPRPARIETYDDHRMAMSFALLGLMVPGIEIADPGCVAKTYPRFFDDLDQLRTAVR